MHKIKNQNPIYSNGEQVRHICVCKLWQDILRNEPNTILYRNDKGTRILGKNDTVFTRF